MRSKTRVAGFLVACGVLCGIAPGSASGEATRQTASATFTERARASSSGLDLEIDYFNPASQAAKPPAVRTIALTLARGARIDTTAVPACEVTDAELMLFGPSACADSMVGGGELRLDKGLPEPARFLDNEVALLNAPGELIFLFRQKLLGARLASHSPISGRTITSSAPVLPGTLPDGAAVDTVTETFDEAANAGYITTPRRCRKRRFWVNKWVFTYADGVTQTVKSRSRCRRR
jgi:hypothetical protein